MLVCKTYLLNVKIFTWLTPKIVILRIEKIHKTIRKRFRKSMAVKENFGFKMFKN